MAILKDFKAPSQYARAPMSVPGGPQEAVRRNPMRLMVEAVCMSCKHEWTAPTVGKCPKCHGDKTKVAHVEACMAVRA